MVKCNNCGVEIDDSFELCPNCGADLAAVNENPIDHTKSTTCSKCGSQITDDADFCPNCGNKLNEVQILRCDECGSEIGENDLICSVCGSKINHPKLCPNCGTPLDDSSDFCAQCGQNINSNSAIVPIIEENLDNVVHETSSIIDRIILFFKQLFGGN